MEEIDQQGGYDADRMLPQSPLVQPGAKVAGRYELVRLLGHGGMGTVWVAKRLEDGQQVAVKFVSPAHMESPETLRRFATEAEAAATLEGRNVVRIFEHGELEDGTPFMVMELLEGESLHERIARSPLSLEETFRIVRHVGAALSLAHEKGIIHRDIKPENVFLSKTADGGYEAKVLDFGVAKFLEGKGAARARTRTGVLVGTPLYMSPEQVRGLKTVDYRTDVYALGALAYAMLTGHEVFPEKNFGELLFKICTSPLPKIRDEVPSIPEAVEEWFLKSCARKPEDRFQSVREQVEALAVAAGLPMQPSMLDAEGTEGEGASTAPRSSMGKSSKKSEKAKQAAREQDKRSAASGEAGGGKSSRTVTIGIVVLLFIVLAGIAVWWLASGAGNSAPSSPQGAGQSEIGRSLVSISSHTSWVQG